jgi:hypothetical protein
LSSFVENAFTPGEAALVLKTTSIAAPPPDLGALHKSDLGAAITLSREPWL